MGGNLVATWVPNSETLISSVEIVNDWHSQILKNFSVLAVGWSTIELSFEVLVPEREEYQFGIVITVHIIIIRFHSSFS